MVELVLIYAVGQIMALRINTDLYYIKFGPNNPKIYDEHLKPLITPNLDLWIQAKTHQRYSLALLHDMCEAFKSGLERNYTKEDVINIADHSCIAAINEIMKNGVIYDYSISYWIEVLGSDKIEKYLKVIANKLDYVVERMGYNKLVAELNRIYKICTLRQINAKFVCEKILERLNADGNDTVYPDTVKLDHKVMHSVRQEISKLLGAGHKSIPESIRHSIRLLNDDKLLQ